jgi:hypothetical protein
MDLRKLYKNIEFSACLTFAFINILNNYLNPIARVLLQLFSKIRKNALRKYRFKALLRENY